MINDHWSWQSWIEFADTIVTLWMWNFMAKRLFWSFLSWNRKKILCKLKFKWLIFYEKIDCQTCLLAGPEDEEHLPWEWSSHHHWLWSCQCSSQAVLEVQEAWGPCAGNWGGRWCWSLWWSWWWSWFNLTNISGISTEYLQNFCPDIDFCP